MNIPTVGEVVQTTKHGRSNFLGRKMRVEAVQLDVEQSQTVISGCNMKKNGELGKAPFNCLLSDLIPEAT